MFLLNFMTLMSLIYDERQSIMPRVRLDFNIYLMNS